MDQTVAILQMSMSAERSEALFSNATKKQFFSELSERDEAQNDI